MVLKLFPTIIKFIIELYAIINFKKYIKLLPGLLIIPVNIYAQRVSSVAVPMGRPSGEGGIQFSHYTAEDGLSVNSVTQILNDSRGFIWFGTTNGLNRFDGYNFKIFLPEPSDSNSISSRSITTLCEDNKGFIWIGTLEGLNRYDERTGKFYRYKNNVNDFHSLSNNYVYSILKDKSGDLWIGTLNGLNKFNRETDNFIIIKKVSDRLNPDSLNSVTDIKEDYKGNLWLGTWNGLTCIRKDGKIVKQFFAQPANSKTFEYRKTSVIFFDKNNDLWIGTNGKGLKKYNINTGKFTDYLLVPENPNTISNGYITSIFQDKINNLWIGTLNGLNKFDSKNDCFIRILNDPQKSSSLISNGISSICEDRSGLIWIGTTGGISRFYQPMNKFYYYQEDKNHPAESLSSSSLSSVFIDRRNNIWVGSFGGLDEIMQRTDQIKHFKHEPQNSNSLSSNFVKSVFEDHNGIFWIGTNNDGLNSYNPETGKFKLYKYDINDPHSISNKGIISICEDRNGTLWFGTWWGLNRFDRKTGTFKRYLADPLNKHALLNDLIWDLFVDSKGTLWIGTDRGGVSKFNPLTDSFTNFTNDSTTKNDLSDNRVFTIYETRDGIMWFGTTNGLNCYNRETDKTIVYNTRNGLPGNIINGILEDEKGYLWIATEKGLSKFDRRTGRFINYNKRNGLAGLEFVQNISAKSGKGILFFGSNGLMYFNPDSIKDEYLTAPVVFTDLKIYNQSVPVSSNGILKESITGTKVIDIPHGNDVITLEYALLDYFDVKRNTFRYKLDGFDIDWNSVGPRNSATYTNLPPGEYTFSVRATNNNGVKNEQEASIKVIIVPAFYQTLLFRLTIVFGLFFVIIIIYQARTRAIKKQNKILEKKVTERTKDLDKTINELNQEIASKDKFFSIIAHDLRSPFVALLGFSNHMVEEINNLSKDEMQVMAENILKSVKLTFGLLENLLQWARIKTGRINFEPEVLNLKIIFDKMAELFMGVAQSKDITLVVDISTNLSVFADLNMVETILRNLISNSIKFTDKGGKIIISATEENNFARIKVKDTGIGINNDKLEKLFQINENISTAGTQNESGSGLGLILCKEFIEINKGQISVNSSIGKGSEFSFILPKISNLN